MRFVASTILSVAILAFVTQSVSAVPAGSTIDVKKVNQESNSILKRDALDELLDGCFKGLVPPEVCEEAFGPGLH